MNLPFRFPNEADTVFDEAQAFRRLSATDRFLTIVDLIASGEKMMAESPRRAESERSRQRQEENWQRIQRELFVSHGH